MTEPGKDTNRREAPTTDARVRIERVFRIVEMIGVIAILLAALPPWGALVCAALGWMLALYVLLTIRDEVEIALSVGRKRPETEPITDRRRPGLMGQVAITLLAGSMVCGLLLAIIALSVALKRIIAQ